VSKVKPKLAPGCSRPDSQTPSSALHAQGGIIRSFHLDTDCANAIAFPPEYRGLTHEPTHSAPFDTTAQEKGGITRA
jgi:hypothetical protein